MIRPQQVGPLTAVGTEIRHQNFANIRMRFKSWTVDGDLIVEIFVPNGDFFRDGIVLKRDVPFIHELVEL